MVPAVSQVPSKNSSLNLQFRQETLTKVAQDISSCGYILGSLAKVTIHHCDSALAWLQRGIFQGQNYQKWLKVSIIHIHSQLPSCNAWFGWHISKYVKQKNHFSSLPNCKVSRVSALKAILESQNKDWTRQHILSHVQSKPLSAPKRSHLRQHWKSPNQISTMINSDMINLVDQNSIVFLKI